MTPVQRVEQEAIAAAQQYAAANGRADDRAAIGLFLAGLAIGARCAADVRLLIVAGYSEPFPGADAILDRWAAALSQAAR